MKRMSFKQWCEKYDIEEMSGRGEGGCSYNQLYDWCEPCWDYQEKIILQLEKEIAEKNEIIEKMKCCENCHNWGQQCLDSFGFDDGCILIYKKCKRKNFDCNEDNWQLKQ